MSKKGIYNVKTPVAKKFIKDSLNKKFTVKRRTGSITGYFSNDNYITPKVLNFGSKENSFNVVGYTTFAVTGSAMVSYLTIEEYIENQDKPFQHVLGSHVVTGTCRHL